MEMYGYQKFTAGNYFPIVTDNNYIQTKQGDMTKKKSTIKNMGITKNTIKNANNPIIIEDIFDVYTRQVDHMSTYNAYVIPLSDLNKVFNYKDTRNEASGSSIKQEIERTYGKAGNAYIDKLLDDINGSIYTEKKHRGQTAFKYESGVRRWKSTCCHSAANSVCQGLNGNITEVSVTGSNDNDKKRTVGPYMPVCADCAMERLGILSNGYQQTNEGCHV